MSVRTRGLVQKLDDGSLSFLCLMNNVKNTFLCSFPFIGDERLDSLKAALIVLLFSYIQLA